MSTRYPRRGNVQNDSFRPCEAEAHLCLSADQAEKLLRFLDRVVEPARIEPQEPPRRVAPPRETAHEWMRAVEQGMIPLDTLEEQLPNVEVSELKVLFNAVRNGPLPMRNRALAMLAHFQGISSAHTSTFLQISRRSVFRFLSEFKSGGSQALLTRRPRSDKKSNNESIKSAVFSLLHSPPATYGINRASWRLADLRRVLGEEYHDAINCDIISTIIRNGGWKWKRARVVLTSNDLNYREKLDAIKRTLSNLLPDEAFFFIDEYGPFAVKIKGGKKRVPPNQDYVVPQVQRSKGWTIVTAALEASQNQMTHFYSRKKDTDETIRMVELLRGQYKRCSTIFLSWDAASWHSSKRLKERIEALNTRASRECAPIVKIMPLPSCSQFHNLVESVFSGMARAIIHNSNYPSLESAMHAIDRYFAERNAHFQEHPQRAGKSIWRYERVPSEFREDQNCKDPAYQFPY